MKSMSVYVNVMSSLSKLWRKPIIHIYYTLYTLTHSYVLNTQHVSFQDPFGPCGLQVKSFGAELLACAKGTRLRKLWCTETVTCWHLNSKNYMMLRYVETSAKIEVFLLKNCFDRWMLSLSAFASAREPGCSIQHTKWSCLARALPEIGWHEHAAHSAERSGVGSLVACVSIWI